MSTGFQTLSLASYLSLNFLLLFFKCRFVFWGGLFRPFFFVVAWPSGGSGVVSKVPSGSYRVFLLFLACSTCFPRGSFERSISILQRELTGCFFFKFFKLGFYKVVLGSLWFWPGPRQVWLGLIVFSSFFYWIWLCFTGFYWSYLVLPSFTGFYWVLLGFNRVLPSFTGFYLALLGFNRVLPSLTGFYWVLPSFTGFSMRFYWVFNYFYWVYNKLYLVLMGYT